MLHTGGPTRPMAPGDPDSPFDNKRKVAFTKTIKPKGHNSKEHFYVNLLASNMWPLTLDPKVPGSPFTPCRPGLP